MTRAYAQRAPDVRHISILRTLQALGPCAQSSIALHTGIKEDTVKKSLSYLVSQKRIAHQHEPNTFEPCVYDLAHEGHQHLAEHANADDVWSAPRKTFARVASVWELGSARA